ncbi:hypothetical protein [Corynebacterium sp. LK2510]|uniref:Rv3212 family protein n=1 Tax=Corynebacterium sp. LK2510 TaxID=3110472 RepID=UPI0034CF0332
MMPPLRRTRGDLIATGVIAVVSAALVGTAVLTAPVRSAHLEPATAEVDNPGKLAAAPTQLRESFRLRDESPRLRPLIAEGMIVTYADGTLTATTPAGESAWTYTREDDLCALDQAWGNVVATYRGPAGCGDVVSIDALTGQYADTRSAPAPDTVTGISSNDRVGYASPTRTELWRSDLVRTVEYGAVEAPQEDDMQPHQCQQTSALTRTELLAVTEVCEDGTFLRLQDTTPEDSRKPEIEADIAIPEGAYLVAIGQDAAAVYDPATSEVSTYSTEGLRTTTSTVPALRGDRRIDDTFHVLPTADLPHHMSYFDGALLVLFAPETLSVTDVFDNAAGTGVGAGETLLFATAEGIAVAQWDASTIEQVIPVDRGGYTGAVFVDSAGAGVVEKRGSDVVYLAAD